jgi:outer membrane protein
LRVAPRLESGAKKTETLAALKNIFGLFIFLGQLVTPLAQTTPQDLNLRAALKLAEAQSLDLKNAENERDIARLEAEVALTKLLPSLDFSSTHGKKEERPKQNSKSSYISEFEFSLTETLFDNGISWTQRKKALLKEKRARLNYILQKDKMALDIASALSRLALAQKTLENQISQNQIILKQYKLIERDYFQGVKSRRDYLRLRTQKSRSILELEDTQTQLKKAQVDLAKLLSPDGSIPDNMTFQFDDIEKTPFNLNLQELGNGEFLATQRAELDFEIHALEKSLVSRNRWPELKAELGAQYGSSGYWRTSDTIASNDSSSWSALLSLNYNIFDWGQRSKERQIAAHQEQSANNKTKLELIQLRSEISKNKEDVLSIQNNLALTKELRDLEKANLNDLETEYRNGKVLYLDLMNGLNDYSQAQLRYLRALTDFRIKCYSLMAQKGKLYEFLTQ